MSNQSSNSPSPNSSSFIYPIKSLLGNIQPAPDGQSSSPPLSTSPELSRSLTLDLGSKNTYAGAPIPPYYQPKFLMIIIQLILNSMKWWYPLLPRLIKVTADINPLLKLRRNGE